MEMVASLLVVLLVIVIVLLLSLLSNRNQRQQPVVYMPAFEPDPSGGRAMGALVAVMLIFFIMAIGISSRA